MAIPLSWTVALIRGHAHALAHDRKKTPNAELR